MKIILKKISISYCGARWCESETNRQPISGVRQIIKADGSIDYRLSSFKQNRSELSIRSEGKKFVCHLVFNKKKSNFSQLF